MNPQLGNDGTVTVKIMPGPGGPRIFVDPYRLHIKRPMAQGPGMVRFQLDPGSQADWRLVAIDFDFEDPNSVGEFSVVNVNDHAINVRNEFTRAENYKYTLWCAPNGMGAPFALDPFIRNEPD